MVQIVKRKKKGRPSNSGSSSPASEERDMRRSRGRFKSAVRELQRRGGRFTAAERELRRSGGKFTAAERELRRSGRRRNVRYNFDYDDYLDDEEEYYFVDQEDDDNRREKKLELLLKLRREESANSSSSEDFDNKPKKIRKIDEDEEEDFVSDFEIQTEKKREPRKEVDSAPGTPTEPSSGFPLPDKKILVLILDKLQKKDIYGVYAEPVDPDELPDYHDIIEHPMDFSTIRSQLENGSYATLEQLESDILLLCSNAMQYNEPDTVYHKQARSIQEMTIKKFQKLRIGNRPSKNLMKLDVRPKSGSLSSKQITRQIGQTVQEPVCSGIASAATFATAGDYQNGSNAVQVNESRRDSSYDGLGEQIPPVIDNSSDKVDDSLSGKGSLTKFGRKLALHDENCRATYNISSQPEKDLESVFSTFDGESKQLIPVGLHVDLAYASSLARFAGSFGHVAWRVASQRIEQILPPGIKFGRGWVGDYEPLPTPILIVEKCNIENPAFFAMPQHTNNTSNRNIPKISIASEDDVACRSSNENLEYSCLNGLKATPTSSTNNQSKKDPVRRSILEGKSSFYGATITNTSASSPHLQHQTSATSSPHLQHQTPRMRNLIEPNMDVQVKVELNGPPSINHTLAPVAVRRQVSNGSEMSTPRSVTNTSACDSHLQHQASTSSSPHLQRKTSRTSKLIEHNKNVTKKVQLNGTPSINYSLAPEAVERQVSSGSEASTPRSVEMISINRNFLQSGSFKHPIARGVGGGFLSNNATQSDVKDTGTVFGGRGPSSCSDAGKVGTISPHGQEHGLSDPVQQMRMLTANNKNHQTSANNCTMSGPQIPLPAQSRKEDSRSAAAVTHPWISVGAGGFRPVGENMSPPIQISMTPNQQPQVSQFRGNFPVHLMQFQQQNNPPFHVLAPQAVRVGNAAQFQNQPMVLPQFVTTDMSRIQVQFPWRGLMHHHAQQPQKQETSPPDLNVSFQSPGSPGKPSRVPVDSQQPDLALQL